MKKMLNNNAKKNEFSSQSLLQSFFLCISSSIFLLILFLSYSIYADDEVVIAITNDVSIDLDLYNKYINTMENNSSLYRRLQEHTDESNRMIMMTTKEEEEEEEEKKGRRNLNFIPALASSSALSASSSASIRSINNQNNNNNNNIVRSMFPKTTKLNKSPMMTWKSKNNNKKNHNLRMELDSNKEKDFKSNNEENHDTNKEDKILISTLADPGHGVNHLSKEDLTLHFAGKSPIEGNKKDIQNLIDRALVGFSDNQANRMKMFNIYQRQKELKDKLIELTNEQTSAREKLIKNDNERKFLEMEAKKEMDRREERMNTVEKAIIVRTSPYVLRHIESVPLSSVKNLPDTVTGIHYEVICSSFIPDHIGQPLSSPERTFKHHNQELKKFFKYNDVPDCIRSIVVYHVLEDQGIFGLRQAEMFKYFIPSGYPFFGKNEIEFNDLKLRTNFEPCSFLIQQNENVINLFFTSSTGLISKPNREKYREWRFSEAHRITTKSSQRQEEKKDDVEKKNKDNDDDWLLRDDDDEKKEEKKEEEEEEEEEEDKNKATNVIDEISPEEVENDILASFNQQDDSDVDGRAITNWKVLRDYTSNTFSRQNGDALRMTEALAFKLNPIVDEEILKKLPQIPFPQDAYSKRWNPKDGGLDSDEEDYNFGNGGGGGGGRGGNDDDDRPRPRGPQGGGGLEESFGQITPPKVQELIYA